LAKHAINKRQSAMADIKTNLVVKPKLRTKSDGGWPYSPSCHF